MATLPKSQMDPGSFIQDPKMLAWIRQNVLRIPQDQLTRPMMERLMQTTEDPPAGLNSLPAPFYAPGYVPMPSTPRPNGYQRSGFPDEASLQGGEGSDTLAGGKRSRSRYTLTSRDVEAINNTAGRLGIRPDDLTAVMMYETIGTMNPDITGGKGGNYQGLIQFGPNERKTYGYRKGMGFAEQVEGPVYRYLKGRGLQPGDDIGRLYRTINGGNRNAKLWKNDGNGTIAQHIERIKADFLPRAQQTLAAIPTGPNTQAMLDVAALNTAPSSVPDQPTAAQGYAPNLGMPPAPAQAAISDMLATPPEQPPQWASNTSFPPQPLPPHRAYEITAGWMPQFPTPYDMPQPIDGDLTGQSAQDVLMGGPRMDPRRQPPGAGPVPPDMGAMRSPADVLNAGPRIRPGGAPDAAMVPDPTISPLRPAVGGPNDRRPQPPTPPPRAQGIPDPRMRPNLTTVAGMPDIPRPPFQSMVAGRPEFPGAIQPPRPEPKYDPADLATLDERMTPVNWDQERAFSNALVDARFYDQQNIMAPPPAPYQPLVVGRPEIPAGFPTLDMDALGLTPPAPPKTYYAEDYPSTTGEFMTRGDSRDPAFVPMAQPQDALAGRFDDAFAPAPQLQLPQTAQDGINSIFGAPPAPAAVPNMAIPFAEVPGFGANPAAAATAAVPPLSMGEFANRFDAPAPQPISMGDFNDRFAGGTVVPAPPSAAPPAVVDQWAADNAPLDIRSPAQGGPPFIPQAAQTAEPPRDKRATEQQKKGFLGRAVGGLLAGPAGALFGGLLGGNGFGTASFTPYGSPTFNNGMGTVRTSGTSAYGNGGQTNWQSGTSNALGGSSALSWKTSTGKTVTAYTDPNTGQTFHSYGP